MRQLISLYHLCLFCQQELVGEHQARRELVTDEVVQQYMTVRPLEF